MKIRILIIVFIVFIGRLSAQMKTSEVVKMFEKGGEVSWEISLNSGGQISLKWNERPNSFKDIKTFVAYQNDNFIGVLSVDKTSISGNVTLSDGAYKITSEKEKIIIEKENQNQVQCGSCSGHSPKKENNLFPLSNFSNNKNSCEPNEHGFVDNSNLCLDNVQIYTDGVLRVYRLALLINYDKFQYEYQRNKDKVRQFWANSETFANELYIRDVAVKFEIVQDDRLIIDSEEKNELNKLEKELEQEIGHRPSTQDKFDRSIYTKAIDRAISSEMYDVGIVCSWHNFNGQAALDAVYSNETKGNGIINNLGASTVAHEVGHMFGGDHTFAVGEDSNKVEPGNGRSIMGYGHREGHPRDFFALYSISTIRRGLTHSTAYYTDKQRQNKEVFTRQKNVVYGIKTSNRRPVIDDSKLKKRYVIPKGTFFKFHINATDPDNNPLLYYAHQTDIRLQTSRSNAVFYSAKPSRNNVFKFENEQTPYQLNSLNGVYRFWLAVSDGILGNEVFTREDHATHYDLVKTDVEIKGGNSVPFVISGVKTKYSAGEQISVTWGIDREIFGAESKVRILMSDDNGQTFKHIITNEAPNNGSFSFKMPNVSIAKGKGVFQIEVIDHIAYTYNKVGFEVTPSQIVFENTPEPTISVKEGNIPEAHSVTARTTCVNQGVQISYRDERNENTIKRTFTATDNCQNQAIFVQHILVEENVEPLQFVGNLPQDRVYHCEDTFDKTIPNVQVIGGKSPKIELIQTRMESDYHINYILKRTWRVTDPVAKPIEHTQLVYVYDNTKPFLITKPQDVEVRNESEIYNYTSTPPIFYDNCGNELLWKLKSQDWKHDEQGNRVVVLTWAATDGTGNETEATQRITVKNTDEIAFLHFPNDVKLSCFEPVPAADFEIKVVNCSDAKVSHTETERIEGNIRIISRVYTATGCSKTISKTQTITITDNEKPVFVGDFPRNLVVNNESEVPQQEDLTATDNCYQNCSGRKAKIKREKIITDYFTGDSKEVINWTITGENSCKKNVPVQKKRIKTPTGYTDTWTATDEFGNTETYSRTIHISTDDTPPVQEVRFTNFPDNQELTCGSSVPTGVTSLSVSGCDETPNVSVTHRDIERGDCRTGRTIERTYTGSACGQTISQTQIITISGDNLAPTFNGELPQNERVTRNNIPSEQRNLTATDNCSTNVSVEKTRSEENNIITETWTARDDCGNEATHRRTITIIQSELEFVNPPQDLNISCANEIPTAPTLTASGNCSPKVAYQGEVRENETCANSFTLVRTWRATDDCGNQKEYRHRIVVSDTQVPEFQGELPRDVSVRENEIPAKQSLRATDNCSSEMNVEPQRERNGNIITETWTARDDCGNEATHTRRITILPEPPAPTPTPIPQPEPNPIDPKPAPKSDEIVVNNWVSQWVGNHFLRIENIEGKEANVKIFNELGQLVFEISGYDNRERVFIGDRNIGGNDKLFSGVYFYILEYKKGGVKHRKTGFLVLKN